jgi:hypothetical protein
VGPRADANGRVSAGGIRKESKAGADDHVGRGKSKQRGESRAGANDHVVKGNQKQMPMIM